MNLLWIRPVEAEQALQPDERRVRDYLDSPGGVSESVVSLADKLGVSRGLTLAISWWSGAGMLTAFARGRLPGYGTRY